MASLLVVGGAEIDLGRQVLCNRPITIGRDEDLELSLTDGSISRQHCRVERDEETGHYLMVDLGSTNGTAVNGRRVDRYPLAEGDKIFLGSSVIRFSFSDAVDLEYQSRLSEMVTTDALTGLASKRQYDATFEITADRAASTGTSLAVMVMDMDGLKQVNDTHGHEMGGYAIVEVSNIMRAVLGDHGTLCRFGGDEFVGCFPGLTRARATELAELLRKRVATHNFVRDGVRVEPTLSIGVATYPDDTDNPAQLFAAADRALYRAKRAGRNRVATPPPLPGPETHDPDGST
jgi:two-component system, cell cycle response regulator